MSCENDNCLPTYQRARRRIPYITKQSTECIQAGPALQCPARIAVPSAESVVLIYQPCSATNDIVSMHQSDVCQIVIAFYAGGIQPAERLHSVATRVCVGICPRVPCDVHVGACQCACTCVKQYGAHGVVPRNLRVPAKRVRMDACHCVCARAKHLLRTFGLHTRRALREVRACDVRVKPIFKYTCCCAHEALVQLNLCIFCTQRNVRQHIFDTMHDSLFVLVVLPTDGGATAATS